jgi:hypothetical protein
MGADVVTSRLKVGVMRLLMALKYPSPSAGFELAILGSKGKHAKHYTTEDDLYKLETTVYKLSVCIWNIDCKFDE